MEEKLKEFISDFWSYKKDKITSDKSLDDLGMYGDDKKDFLIFFIKKFDIDSINLDYNKYCESETFNPLSFLFIRMKEKNKVKLTIEHLVKVAEKKIWFEPNVEDTI